MNWEVAIQLLGTILGGSGVAWGVGVFRDKRKADAEAGSHNATAAELIDTVSARMIERYDKRWQEDQIVISRQGTEIESLKRDLRIMIDNVQQHEEWDILAVNTFRELGHSIPTPPTLQLPNPSR